MVANIQDEQHGLYIPYGPSLKHHLNELQHTQPCYLFSERVNMDDMVFLINKNFVYNMQK